MEDPHVAILLFVLGICFTNADEGSVYFIAGGDGGAYRNIELYHPTIEDLNCTITPPTLNNDWRQHRTFYHDNTIYLCGGIFRASTCISHSKDKEGWKVHNLTSPRQYGHSTVVLENTLYIIGGRDGINNNDLGAFSTPLPLTDQPVLTSVPNLSYKGRWQCVAKVDSYNLIVTGGSHLSSVIQYNAKTSTQTSLTSLQEFRYRHGCVAVKMDNKKYLIVTGGSNPEILQTTEMIDLEGNSRVSLGNLQTTRRYHSMIAAKVGVLVIGGYNGRGATKTVEMLDWTTKKWKQFEQSIKIARSAYGGAVEIPISLFDCQGPGITTQASTTLAGTTNTQTSTTPITTCPPPPTCPTAPPPPTCPTVPATQTCPPTQTCPTVPDPTTVQGEVYFIAGGYPTPREIEFYHPTIEDLKCTITPPPLSDNWENHRTFYHDNTIYLCGGIKGTESICISHGTEMKGWKVHELSSPIYYGHSTVVMKNSLYIIGGYAYRPSRQLGAFSTPLPLTDQPVLTPVPNLSYKGVYQCVAKVDSSIFIVCGIFRYNNGSRVSNTIQYNVKTNTVTSLPSFNIARSQHGCIVVEKDNKKFLIVTGGGNKRSTEMIDLDENLHIPLGNLSTTRYGHSMIATKIGLSIGVMVIGGYSNGVNGVGLLKSVEMLDWMTKKWKAIEPSISTAKYRFGGAMKIPASIFNCLRTTTTQASTTPITTCPPTPTCPTPPPTPTCPTVPAPQTCPPTATCPPTPTCPTMPAPPSPPTCPPTPTCPDKTCPPMPTCPTMPAPFSLPTCPPTPTCPTVPAPTTVPPPPTCKKNKKCAKKKGKCFGKGDTVPPNAQRKGWCSKKKGCRCYKV